MGVEPSASKKVRLTVRESPRITPVIVFPIFVGIYLPISLCRPPNGPLWLNFLAFFAKVFFFFRAGLSPGLVARSLAGIFLDCPTPSKRCNEPFSEGLMLIPEYMVGSYGDGLGEGETELDGLSEALGEVEVDGLRDGLEDELGEVEADGESEALGEELTELDGLSERLAEAEGDSEALTEELGDCDGLALPEVELDGLSEAEGENEALLLAEELGDRLAEVLVLGESEALGEVEALGDNEELAEALGEVEAEGEADELGEVEALGEILAEGLSEAEGETSAPATRATTEEPAEIGFQIQIKRIRPEVIAAVPTVIVMSRLIAKTGKLVTVLAIKVAWGLVPVQTS